MRLATSIRKSGRRVGVVEVELMQGDRTAGRLVAQSRQLAMVPPAR
jgi:acyl-coenzyme A thioesterase PaaI-like protein